VSSRKIRGTVQEDSKHMENFIVRKVAVLGAGVMGAQIAAHCVNARVPVVLFDLPDTRTPDKSGIARRAIEGLRKLKPAPLGREEDARFIDAANYDEHLELLRGCDLVIEAIAERTDWKLDLYRKVGGHIGDGAIFASNTSGLSITALSQGLPEALRPRFCGVHFFNPPRYMHLVELIPTPATGAAVLDRLEGFLTSTLGKGVVRAKDTPNFIANRVGIFGMLATIHEAGKYGLAIDVVDDLTGTRLGRAKSATFRTADVVGLDTMAHVVKTMQDTLGPDKDPFAALYAMPPVLKALVDKGALGQKAGAGFYRKQGKAIQVLDAKKGEYVDSAGKADELVGRILNKPMNERLALLRRTEHPQARFLWAIFRDAFHYAALHLESIADTARDVDFALRWGFGWESGPFETWQAAGWKQVAEWVQADIDAGEALCKAPLPGWVLKGPVADAGAVHTPAGSWSPARKAFVPATALPVYGRQIFRAPLAGDGAPTPPKAGVTVHEDDACRIWHWDSGMPSEVLVFSIKSKMHALGPGVLEGLGKAIDVAEARFRGLVVWSPDEPFSVGADLKAMMPVFMSGGPKAIGKVVREFQNVMLRVKYAQVPVVAAIRGMALGGGCELSLQCARRVASLESYIGLVEVGVGLVPGGGGLKEGALRAAAAAAAGGVKDLTPFIAGWFENAAMAKVSTSALEAQRMGYLLASDTIVFHAHELLWTAIGEAYALHALGYRPPLRPRLVPAAGRSVLATIKAQVVNMREGGFVGPHDFHLASCVAEILCGGDVDAGTPVDEQWFLDLESRHFEQLVAHPKTQERMMSFMQTGKPVRN
jgi:3-hydroxyacyl-CoA dehydrogenase